MSPPSNAFLRPEQLQTPEVFLPLHAYVCDRCFLVQLAEYEAPDRIFSSDYAYFSSYSESWLRHAKRYVEMIIARRRLDADSRVIEIASNDGYLLQYFVERGVPALGIEPAANCAAVAQAKGIPTLVRFFGSALADELAREGRGADLIIGNNVFAHVPQLKDFVAGLKRALNPGGLITLEFPHVMRLIEQNQFDTIYHEHFSYFSLLTATQVMAAQGLTVVDVEELPTHGGSLRLYAQHAEEAHPVAPSVSALLDRERAAGLDRLATYTAFGERVKATKRQLLDFLIEAKDAGRSVVGYGAAAKGNTLLNYGGIRSDFLDYVVDRSPHKQGRFLPGTRIPVLSPDRIAETRPDYVLILPWNLKDEVMQQMSGIREWGGRFVVPIPRVEVLA